MRHLLRAASLAAAALAVLALATPASAGATWGPRAGLSFNPDQIALGAHVDLPVGTALYIVPSGDVAFGDDAFTFSLNGDLEYRFQGSGSVRPYLGGGFTYINVDPDADGADSFDKAGASVLGGFWLNATGSTPFFIEGKLFLDDELPDFKVMAGVNL